MNKKFYITTTLPYVNAEMHVGFAMEIIRADVLARLHLLLGEEVFFNTGTDEHGLKIYRKAQEEEKDLQEYVDEWAKKFEVLKPTLNLFDDLNFIRTTDKHHVKAVQEFWKRVDDKGYIYKGKYKTKYCVGCELEKQDSDIEDGQCPVHPNKELEIIDEENYFFKFSAFEKRLLELYEKNPKLVVPPNRLHEIKNFVVQGLKDFSISRLKEKMPWGIEVPGDKSQVMYVWFDALINYISALGWPENEKKFTDFWGTKEKPKAIQIAGKDNLRQQTAMWQAMLMAADLPNTKQILINGFIVSGGVKMSKSLGNVVSPFEYVKKYGTDALRYFLLAKISSFEDGDFTKEKFEEVYQSDLANGLGNLVARVAAMVEKEGLKSEGGSKKEVSAEVRETLDIYDFKKAMEWIWEQIKEVDVLINEKKVWEMEGEEKVAVLKDLIERVRQIAIDLQPFLPETAEKILKQFGGLKIVKEESLFPRLEK